MIDQRQCNSEDDKNGKLGLLMNNFIIAKDLECFCYLVLC